MISDWKSPEIIARYDSVTRDIQSSYSGIDKTRFFDRNENETSLSSACNSCIVLDCGISGSAVAGCVYTVHMVHPQAGLSRELTDECSGLRGPPRATGFLRIHLPVLLLAGLAYYVTGATRSFRRFTLWRAAAGSPLFLSAFSVLTTAY
eukprot:COSAG02_NODE_153_length_33128_cov_10.471253_14_plen_149_part_00